MPFKKTSFFPLYVEYVDEIFNPHPHPHIPHMRIIRIFRIFRIRMANPSLDLCHSKTMLSLTDVTLADEDSNSVPTDDVNRAFLGNVAMQVAPSDGQH